MKQILIDTIPFEVSPELIRESEEKNSGRVIVTGVLQRSGAKNQNGRVYPKEILMREAERYAKTEIAERRALGELDHPESSVVNLQNASHNVQKIWWKGNDLMGKVEILSTPSGNILKELLVDCIPFEISREKINESIKNNDGRLVVNGVLQRAEAKNQNGRVYPRDTLVREAKKYAQVNIAERRALGELDHPDSSVVNLNNASHNILEMHWKGDDLLGTVEILSTPAGNILKELFKSGIKLGISSRGLGSVKEIHEDEGGDTVEVQPDFELIAFDFVSNPSTHGAFMHPNKMNEGVISEGIGTRNGTCCHDCAIEDIINDIFRG